MKKFIYLAGGCFWGVQKYFDQVEGVLETEAGYANGDSANPTYEEVCNFNTGHAETVKIVYDDTVISLKDILNLFYDIIDPTSINCQGADVGTQYRTGIFYVDYEDEKIIRESVRQLYECINEPVAIEILPLVNYYPAEDYHQKYLQDNPYGYCHIPAIKFDLARYFRSHTRKNSD